MDARTEQSLKNRMQTLEKQVLSRDREITLLRHNLSEKNKLIEALSEPHLKREQELSSALSRTQQDLLACTEQLTTMAVALDTASQAIEHIEIDRKTLETQLHQLQLENADLKEKYEAYLSKISMRNRLKILTGAAGGLLMGFLPFFILAAIPAAWHAWNQTVREQSSSLPWLETVTPDKAPSPKRLAALKLPTITPTDPPIVLEALSTLPITPDSWTHALKMLENAAFGNNSDSIAILNNFPPQSKPVVIARNSFMDLISNRGPATLPSRVPEGFLLHHWHPGQIHMQAFSQELKRNSIPNADLCSLDDITPRQYKRLAIFLSGNAESFLCFQRLLKHSILQHPWEEISIVSFVEKAQLAVSIPNRGHILFQEISLNWLDSILALDLPNAETLSKRAQQLASLTRPYLKASDIRVTISNTSAEGSKHFLFGNFAIIPQIYLTFPSSAQKISAISGMPTGKEVSFSVGENTRAVFISGTEATLEAVLEDYIRD